MVHKYLQKKRLFVFFDTVNIFSVSFLFLVVFDVNYLISQKISLYSKVWSPGSVHGTLLYREIVPLTFCKLSYHVAYQSKDIEKTIQKLFRLWKSDVSFLRNRQKCLKKSLLEKNFQKQSSRLSLFIDLWTTFYLFGRHKI